MDKRSFNHLIILIGILFIAAGIYGFIQNTESPVKYTTDGEHWKALAPSMFERQESPQDNWTFVSFMNRSQIYYHGNDTLELNLVIRDHEAPVTVQAGNVTVMINGSGIYKIRIPGANISTSHDVVNSSPEADYIRIPIHDFEVEESNRQKGIAAIEADYYPAWIGPVLRIIEFVSPDKGNQTGVTSMIKSPDNGLRMSFDVEKRYGPVTVEVHDTDYNHTEYQWQYHVLGFEAPVAGSYHSVEFSDNMTGRVHLKVVMYDAETKEIYSQNFTLSGNEYVKNT